VSVSKINRKTLYKTKLFINDVILCEALYMIILTSFINKFWDIACSVGYACIYRSFDSRIIRPIGSLSLCGTCVVACWLFKAQGWDVLFLGPSFVQSCLLICWVLSFRSLCY